MSEPVTVEYVQLRLNCILLYLGDVENSLGILLELLPEPETAALEYERPYGPLDNAYTAIQAVLADLVRPAIASLRDAATATPEELLAQWAQVQEAREAVH